MQRAADIKRRLLHRDMVYKGFIRDCRIAVATTTNLANVAKERFQIQNAGATSLFTRSLTASAMLSSFLKGEERIILEMQDQNDAALSHVYAESLHLGEVRGFIHGKDVHDAAKENQVGGFFLMPRGWGTLLPLLPLCMYLMYSPFVHPRAPCHQTRFSN